MKNLKIAIGCDHGGYTLKNKVAEHLKDIGVQFKDFGCHTCEAVDYPIVAKEVANAIAAGKYERGILICGTGIGMSMVANKIKGIRAASVENTFSARASRSHNDANILCLGERVLGANLALDIVDVWLKTGFEGGRHAHRVDMVE